MRIIKVKKGVGGSYAIGHKRGGAISREKSVARDIYEKASDAGENAKDVLRNVRVKKPSIPKKYITFE